MNIVEANKFRDEIKLLREELGKKHSALSEIEKSCNHNWSAIESFYEDEPDFNGFIDYKDCRKKSVLKWKRYCSSCGKLEITSQFNIISQHVPNFGDNNIGVYFHG